MPNRNQVKLPELLISYFEANPLGFNDLNQRLTGENLHYNKTSIYRQLAKMTESGLLAEVLTTNGSVWEIANSRLHAHLDCKVCNKIVCINLNELDPAKTLTNNLSFRIDSINLSGTCTNCLRTNYQIN